MSLSGLRTHARIAAFALLAGATRPAAAQAQDKPRAGGELLFVVPAEPTSYDAHRESTFALIFTPQWHRIIPHSSKVRGWTITPSHFLNNELDTVWLAE
jgi:hypothetical protein